MTDTAGWLASNGIGGPVGYFENAGLLAQRAADADDLASERAEAERKAALEEAHDQRMTAMYMAGVQPGAVMARAALLADLDGEISEAADQLRKLERRRDRLQAEGRQEAEVASRAAGMAQRSAEVSPAGLGDAAAQIAVVQRELAAQQRTDAILARARSRQRSRSVSRSVSLPKARCTESTGDYWDPCPAHGGVNHGGEAERPAGTSVRADDLVAMGYTRQMAEWACTPVSQREITR